MHIPTKTEPAALVEEQRQESAAVRKRPSSASAAWEDYCMCLLTLVFLLQAVHVE